MATAILDRVSNKAIGQMLVEKGIITTEQLEEALAAGKRDGVRVGEALLQLGYVSREALGYVLGEQYGIRPMELHPSMLDERLIRRFPLDLLEQHQVLPLIEVEDELVVVVSDPNNNAGLSALAALAPAYTISPQLADAGQLRRCLESLRDRSRVSAAGATPISTPSEYRVESSIPAATDAAFSSWLVATALQQPGQDLVLRKIDGACQVARRALAADGGVEEIHRFPGELFSSVRDSLLRNCVTLEHTNDHAAMGNAPLRFAGRDFDLLILTSGTQRSPMLRLRALEHSFETNASSSTPLPALKSGKCSIVTYTIPAELDAYLDALVIHSAGTQVILLMQETTRRSYDGVYAFPAALSDASAAAMSVGATCVIFDAPPSLREVYRLMQGGAELPAVVICAPTFPGADEPAVFPDLDELRRRFPSEVIHVGSHANIHGVSNDGNGAGGNN